MATFPERALAWVNGVLVRAADALLAPLLSLPPLLSLLLLSLLTAAAIVPVIGRTTDQPRMRQTKRRIQAALFEIRLFNDDPRAVARAVFEALRHNLTYLRLSVVPLAVMSVPLMLLIAHLHPFFGYTGLQPGSTALLTVTLAETAGAAGSATLSLETPGAVVVETGPVQLVGANEVLWRLAPVARGEFIATIRVGEATVAKTLRVSDGPGRRSPARLEAGILNQLLYPSEPPLPPAGLASVTLHYPDASVDVLGLRVHWLLVFVVLTMGFALLIARRVGVSI